MILPFNDRTFYFHSQELPLCHLPLDHTILQPSGVEILITAKEPGNTMTSADQYSAATRHEKALQGQSVSERE